jgi:mannosyl-3-phosphoglycerate phosphatase
MRPDRIRWAVSIVRASVPAGMRPRRLLVATDLDASLLDEDSYSWEEARPALDELRRRGALLVLASSKTFAEMEPLARALGFDAPLIVENGGALDVPLSLLRREPPGAEKRGGYWRVELGQRRRTLQAALSEIAAARGARVVGFGSLDAAELARLTGLPRAGAALALAREYDEPFLLEAPARLDEIAAAAERRGLRVTQGGRFLHITGRTDKGRALRALLELLAADAQIFASVALGDSPNDLELLLSADRAIVIPRRAGADARLLAALPQAVVAPARGPSGWNLAVLDELRRLDDTRAGTRLL